jgi:hypothetical protein
MTALYIIPGYNPFFFHAGIEHELNTHSYEKCIKSIPNSTVEKSSSGFPSQTG